MIDTRRLRLLLLSGVAQSVILTSTLAQAQEQTAFVDIPAQSAQSALLELGQQADVDILFSPASVRHLQSQAVVGMLTPEEAVRRILDNPSLEVIRSSGGVIVVRESTQPAPGNAAPSAEAPVLMAAAAPPPAAVQPPAPVAFAAAEEITITGSLIGGASVVGVPVTTRTQVDFMETGAITVSDMLVAIPTLVVVDSNNITSSGSFRGREQTVTIHGLGTTDATESLLLINSMRYPAQGANPSRIDPSIIPQLAINRVDVLATGASATYGSDAVAGVINVLLKRGVDGATTILRGAVSPGIGGESIMFSQQYGRTWDTGGITLTFETYEEAKVRATKRDYLTRNFEAFGLDDRNALASNMPGILTTGSPAAPPGGVPAGFSERIGTRFCDNCYSIPVGAGWNYGDQAPGPTTSWNALLANKGVNNQRDPYVDAWMLPHQQRNAAVMTFDQEIYDGVSLFADAFYSNRRSDIIHPSGNSPAGEQWTSGAGIPVPMTNPYYPAGAPAGLRIHYTLSLERPYRETANEVASRYAFGFDFFDLPYDWNGRTYYSMSRSQNWVHSSNTNINRNQFSAALGNTIGAVDGEGTVPGQQAYTKPDNIPYLNVFCDATLYQCNSPLTLDYISAFRDRDAHWNVGEIGVNFDGPVVEMPGGPMLLAIAANRVSNHFEYLDDRNGNQHSTAIVERVAQYEADSVWAVMGEINLPIFGAANAVPFIQELVLTAAYRFDKYDFINEYVKTPKVGIDWGLGYGITLFANWGTAFRAPNFSERGEYAGSRITGLNQLGAQSSDTVFTDCASINGSAPGVAIPGSVTAILNPDCIGGIGSAVPDPTGEFSRPGGLIITGGGGIVAATIDPNGGVSPSEATSWAAGTTFVPTEGPLAGLAATVTYYDITIKNQLGLNTAGLGVNDPDSFTQYVVINDPTLPITHPANADFYAKVLKTLAHPRSDLPPEVVDNIKFIQNQATTNIGFLKISGVEFDTRYDWEMGNFGAMHVGLNGVYRLTDEQQSVPTSPINDAFEGKNSGGRLKGRGRIGWTNGIWDSTLFVNYYPHSGVDSAFTPPPCYWLTGFSAGDCYPGSPYMGPHDVFPNRSPEQFLFDLTLGYQTGTRFMNEHLHNVGVQFTVLNMFDKRPPFHYDTRSSSGYPRAFDTQYNPLQRRVSLALIKAW